LVSELKSAIDDFKGNYRQFAEKNPHYLLIEDEEDFYGAFSNSQAEVDIRKAAQTFGNRISTVLRKVDKKTEVKWTTRLGDFLIKLYPLARLSLAMAGGIAEVISFHKPLI
jgi:hypothetical protein